MADVSEVPTTRLFVGNLAWETTDATLKELFAKYGAVREARVAVDRNTGRSRGFGFVSMDDAAAADEAVRNITGSDVNGRTIRVEVSTGDRKPRAGGDRGGDFRGGRGGFGGGDRSYGGGGDRSYGGGGDRYGGGGRDFRGGAGAGAGAPRDFERRDDRRGGGRDFDRNDRGERTRSRDRSERDRSRDRY
eukprot:gene17420-20011_t